MKIISAFLVFLFYAQTMIAYAGTDLSDALSQKFPLGGFTIKGEAVEFQQDFFLNGYVALSQIEIDSLVATYLSIDNVRFRRLVEIKQQSVERFKGYELYSDLQSVIDYKAALRAIPTTAATEMAALPDVASVKNYQPTWPPKPNL